jgi:hypothetical protein
MTHETPCTRSDLSARCLQPAFASFLPSLPPLFRIASWSTPHGRCRHLRRWWRPHPACQRWGVRAGELRRFPTRKAGPQQGCACGTWVVWEEFHDSVLTGGRGPRRCTIQPDLVEDRPVMSSSSSTGLAGEVLYYFLGDNIIIATIYPTYELSNGPH